MKNERITIDKIRLEGFRAYLRPQTLSFRGGKNASSLAVFAPNGRGKSGLVDSFEYYFSMDGTLKRLGRRSAQTNAGPVAMGHVDAEEANITPTIHFWFRQGEEKFDDARTISGSLPTSAERVLSHVKVPFIIRGHELRRFVEGKTPADQYVELASWLALDPLLAIQNNLGALRRSVNDKLRSTAEFGERSRDLKRLTSGKVTTNSGQEICTWFNEQVLSHLDSSLKLREFLDSDPAFKELCNRQINEQEAIGLGPLKRLLSLVEDLFRQGEDPEGSPSGRIIALQGAVKRYENAIVREAGERSKASQAVFIEIWTRAQELFDNDIDMDKCPVCGTDFTASPHGSHDQIRLSLGEKISELKSYREALTEMDSARSFLDSLKTALTNDLSEASTSLREANYECNATTAYSEFITGWDIGDNTPDSQSAVEELIRLRRTIEADVKAIENRQGEHTYGKALSTAQNLLRVKVDLERIERTKAEMVAISDQLNQQSHAINTAIVGHIQGLIGKLRENVEILYREIQGGSGQAPPIHLVLSDPTNVDQRRARLLIDFSENRRGVLPSGYLSDSQIHTLALALRLAAIRMFNPMAPIIVLDDVVTSYDVDHRKTIAGVLGRHFSDFQLVLVTHDEQFFNLLKDQLPSSLWNFRRITEVRPGFGPVFHDHRTPDDVIQAKLDCGESAGEYIRQAEEEWLLDICRDFGTKVEIRPLDRSFQYDRAELADSLASFLKSAQITPPSVLGNSNSFLLSLQRGVVENFASHFSDNPYKVASVGDERTRWEEFKEFRQMFVCSSCGKDRFRRPRGLTKPVCYRCQQPFEFQVAKPDA